MTAILSGGGGGNGVQMDSGSAPTVDHATALVDGNVLYYDQAAGRIKGQALLALPAGASAKDLFVYNGSNYDRLPIGADGSILQVTSGALAYGPAPSTVFHPSSPMVSGYWYSTQPFGTGNTQILQGKTTAIPFVPGKSCTLNALSVQVKGTPGGAGSVHRLGIFSDGGGFPSQCLLDAGTVDTTVAANTYCDATISYAVSKGASLWLVATQQANPTPAASLLSVSNSGGNSMALPVQRASNAVGVALNFASSHTGAYPATVYAASDWAASDRGIVIFAKAA